MSSYADQAGDMFVIITVLQLPPSESFNNLVNLLSRYGMCVVAAALLPYTSHRAFIQLPNANKLRLIFAPSTILIPRLLVYPARSLPAKSIKDNLATEISADVPWARSLCSTVTCNTAWDRLLASLASVRSLVRASLPWRMNFMISEVLVVITSMTPATWIPLTASSRSSKDVCLPESKSLMTSL